MPAAKKSVERAVAATQEVAATPALKTIEWNGLELSGPAELPADVIWALADIEDGKANGMTGFFRSVLGDEQVARVREQMRADGVTLDGAAEAFRVLLEAITDAYGMAEGD